MASSFSPYRSLFLSFIIIFFNVSFALAVPSTGPEAQTNKSILFISQDVKNGGITTLYRNFQTATNHLKWQLQHENGFNDLLVIKSIINTKARHYDALVLGGIAFSSVEEEILGLQKEGVVVMGWHIFAEPGVYDNAVLNIATKSKDVAKMAADYIINESNKEKGVVIINDKRFAVANAKTQKMADLVLACSYCKLLEIVNVSISSARAKMPQLIIKLNNKYGKEWTHTLAINDVYFDDIDFPLKQIKRQDIKNVAAGDGSINAFSRMKSGQSQQVATVSEPLALQGWQLADELNRSFAKVPTSNFVSYPILVDTDFLKTGGQFYRPGSSFHHEKQYLSVWFK